jgi:hypothetical protein
MPTLGDLKIQNHRIEIRCHDCTRSAVLVTDILIEKLRKRLPPDLVYLMPVENIAKRMVCSSANCQSKNLSTYSALSHTRPFEAGYEYPEFTLS